MVECNVDNRTIFCDDNLEILQGINSECIDLIYLDPPFNKNKKFTAPIGTSAEGASFKDIFREDDLKEEWLITIQEDHPDLYHYLNGIRGIGKPYNFAYLAYMAIRLIECHRVLKQTGSLYLHCDPTMSHYLKTTMDCIFGEDNFVNELIWYYRGAGIPKKDFARRHDVIFRYTKKSGKQYFDPDPARQPYAQATVERFSHYIGNIRGDHDYGQQKLNPKGKHPDDVFTDIQPIAPSSNDRIGYPTQKPLALLERIIKTSSNKNDVVLDPFCGCATTCVAAGRLSRNWIGVDISVKAYELVKERLNQETRNIWNPDDEVNMRTDPPKRTDLGEDYRERKFVYVISHPAYPSEYKIGIAKDWKLRLNAYQISDPDRQYKVEFKHETPWFRETEQFIHNKFENKHEWVKGDLPDIIREIKNYKTADSN